MKKEYIDFDLDDYDTKWDLEKGYKIWSDPDEDIVGRLYTINYLKAPSMDELIDVTYDSLIKISSKIYFYRIYKFCIEFYPNQLYVKIYTIFNTKWDLKEYKTCQTRPKYNRLKIDKGIEWLNETFDEVVDEIIPDTSKKRKMRSLIWMDYNIKESLNEAKSLLNEVKTGIDFDQMYKIENEISTEYGVNPNGIDEIINIFGEFFFIYKNDCDDGYNEAVVKKSLEEFDRMFPD
jgi:hypothetical protein